MAEGRGRKRAPSGGGSGAENSDAADIPVVSNTDSKRGRPGPVSSALLAIEMKDDEHLRMASSAVLPPRPASGPRPGPPTPACHTFLAHDLLPPRSFVTCLACPTADSVFLDQSARKLQTSKVDTSPRKCLIEVPSSNIFGPPILSGPLMCAGLLPVLFCPYLPGAKMRCAFVGQSWRGSGNSCPRSKRPMPSSNRSKFLCMI